MLGRAGHNDMQVQALQWPLKKQDWTARRIIRLALLCRLCLTDGIVVVSFLQCSGMPDNILLVGCAPTTGADSYSVAQHLEHLQRVLPAAERRLLLKDLPLAPAWMHRWLRDLATVES